MLRPIRLATVIPTMLLMGASVQAQQNGYSGVGLKLSGQWTTLGGAGTHYQPVVGALGGLYVPILAGNRFELQPELLISYQGARTRVDEGVQQELRLVYAQLPIMAKVYLSNVLNAQFGVQAGKLLSARTDDQRIDDGFEPWDLGFIGGVGVDFESGFDISARYYHGHTPILSDATVEFPVNRCAQLGFGYRFAQFQRRSSH